MTIFDTEPVALDEAGHKQRRRMSDQKIQEWANSALLKLLQYAITAIAVPLAFMALSSVLDRLSSIEAALQNSKLIAATIELRVQTSERNAERIIAIESLLRAISEQNIKQDYEIQRLRDLIQNPRSAPR